MPAQEGTIPEETFRKAQVTTLDEALAAANRIGYPVMVKASEGGGGKGIRMSHSEEDMRSHFVQVRNLIVERCLESLPRVGGAEAREKWWGQPTSQDILRLAGRGLDSGACESLHILCGFHLCAACTH